MTTRPSPAAVISRAISAAVACTASDLAAFLAMGSPPGVGGSIHTWRSAQGSDVSHNGLRVFLPNWTA